MEKSELEQFKKRFQQISVLADNFDRSLKLGAILSDRFWGQIEDVSGDLYYSSKKELRRLRTKEISPVFKKMLYIGTFCMVACIINLIIQYFVYYSLLGQQISIIIFFSAFVFDLLMLIPYLLAYFRQNRRIYFHLKKIEMRWNRNHAEEEK